jgi:uncharacterized protein (TIGR02300 family)
MTKPELGTKRLCAECGVRYYDLNATVVTCPKCSAPFQAVATTMPTRSGPRPPPVRRPEVAARKTEPISPDPSDSLIEELDEDDVQLSEISGRDAKDQEGIS